MGRNRTTFPYKLYDLLEYSTDSEYSSTISWTPDGKGVIISSRERLMDDNLLPRFFAMTKYRSLKRQFNLWDYKRLENVSEEVWYNPNFVRGKPEGLSRMILIHKWFMQGQAIKQNRDSPTSLRPFNKFNIFCIVEKYSLLQQQGL